MATAADSAQLAWWREPTREQWYAWVAAWLGWVLDAFDFTIFLLIMVPIAQTFQVPLPEVAAVLTLTLWMRFVGATASGWLADRIGRKAPLMLSIAWYSACNLLAGLAPTFWLVFLFRGLLGIGMGGEWPAGASLAMETWPMRSRGFMGCVLQSSWGLGALLSAAAYGALYNSIGWRGLLILGVLPALLLVYIRFFVKEPAVWLENRRLQRTQQREVRLPLLSIFKPAVLGNTLTACWWMTSLFIVAYTILMFPTYLQRDLHLSPALVALPVMLQNAAIFVSSLLWGFVTERFGRRWAMIIPAIVGFAITPFYLLTSDYTMIVIFFALQGAFAAGGIWLATPSYLSERFPTEVRATAAGFCYHQGGVWGGFVAPVLAYLAANMGVGFPIPMLIATSLGLVSVVVALLLSPETRGKELVPDLVLA